MTGASGAVEVPLIYLNILPFHFYITRITETKEPTMYELQVVDELHLFGGI